MRHRMRGIWLRGCVERDNSKGASSRGGPTFAVIHGDAPVGSGQHRWNQSNNVAQISQDGRQVLGRILCQGGARQSLARSTEEVRLSF